MIDKNEALKAFKDKFYSMSFKERELYLKKMGFSFGNGSQKKRFGSRQSPCRPIRCRVYHASKTGFKSSREFDGDSNEDRISAAIAIKAKN